MGVELARAWAHRPAGPGIPTAGYRVGASAALGATAVVRLWPLVVHHMLGQVLEFDDGAYYSAAAHLLGGRLPYRDFAFVHPPGIVLLLAPFALLARVTSDATAMDVARLAIVGVTVVNCGLIMHIARRAGRTCALVAGFAYASWGASALAERTVLLEPLINLGLLVSVAMLSREHDSPGAWRVTVAGAALGVALATKIWVAADVVVVVPWVAWRFGGRRCARYAGGVAFGATVVCLPFFVAAPGAMWRAVVVDQLSRHPRSMCGGQLLHLVAGVGTFGYACGRVALPLAVVVAALAGMVGCALAGTGLRIWAVLAALQVATVLAAPTYFYHYIDFAAPAVAVCFGVSAARVLRAAAQFRRGLAGAVAVVLAAAIGALAWSAAVQRQLGTVVGLAETRAFASAHTCVFSDFPSLLVAADVETREVRAGCRTFVDPVGAEIVAGGGAQYVAGPIGTAVGAPSWQAATREMLRRSDAAIFVRWRVRAWTPETWAVFDARFVRSGGAAGGVELYSLRGRQGRHS